jgi:Holliday junction resolvase
MANSRNKGASFERAIARELFRELGIEFKRDLEQYQESERGDLVTKHHGWPFVIECKAYASGADARSAWVAQVFKAAETTGLHPALIYKFNNKPVRVRVWMDAIAEAHGGTAVCTEWADLSIQGFAYVARELMARRSQRIGAGVTG